MGVASHIRPTICQGADIFKSVLLSFKERVVSAFSYFPYKIAMLLVTSPPRYKFVDSFLLNQAKEDLTHFHLLSGA